MDRLKFLQELVGDMRSEFVAAHLKETYLECQQHRDKVLKSTEKLICPIWSYDVDEEKAEIDKMLSAIEQVYSWYSTSSLT